MTAAPAEKTVENLQAIAGAILGGAVGDALGVPVEFTGREQRRRDPVTDMRGYGTHNQPAGTWSDDTSLALCLAESLAEAGVDYRDQATRFVAWLHDGAWTPHGHVFDIGNATREAISRLSAGVEPTEAGLAGEYDCGNGSLMRIAPLGLYLAWSGEAERVEAAMNCSRLTHRHPRCQLACVMFTEIVAALVRGCTIEKALEHSRAVLTRLLNTAYPEETPTFERLLSTPTSLAGLADNDISSSGYVIHCLEASLWCALRAASFRDGVLAAVNLGDDADTTGAVAGALLGLRFGRDQIPRRWIDALARVANIETLIERFQAACLQRWRANR